MDINIRMSNLTPGELALLIPVLEQIQKQQDERQAQRAEIKAEVAKQFAEKEADETPVAVEVPEEAPPMVEVPKQKVTIEEVRAALNKLKADKGAAVVREVLDGLGVKRVPDLPEELYEKLVMEVVPTYYGGDGQ